MREKTGRCNTNARGSAADRRARKLWLLEKFGDGVKAACWECAAIVDFASMMVDRIIPGEFGGRYSRDNIRIHCRSCSCRQGQRRSVELRIARRMMEEC